MAVQKTSESFSLSVGFSEGVTTTPIIWIIYRDARGISCVTLGSDFGGMCSVLISEDHELSCFDHRLTRFDSRFLFVRTTCNNSQFLTHTWSRKAVVTDMSTQRTNTLTSDVLVPLQL
jgi:hypothetical protein